MVGSALAVVVVGVRCTFVSIGTRILPARVLRHVAAGGSLPPPAAPSLGGCDRGWGSQLRGWTNGPARNGAGPDAVLEQSSSRQGAWGEVPHEEARPGEAMGGRGGTGKPRPASALEASM